MPPSCCESFLLTLPSFKNKKIFLVFVLILLLVMRIMLWLVIWLCLLNFVVCRFFIVCSLWASLLPCCAMHIGKLRHFFVGSSITSLLCVPLVSFIVSLLWALSPPCCELHHFLDMRSWWVLSPMNLFFIMCSQSFSTPRFQVSFLPLLVLFVTSLFVHSYCFFQFHLVLFNISILPPILFLCRRGRKSFFNFFFNYQPNFK